MSNIKGNDLLTLGYVSGKALGLALHVASNSKHSTREEILEALRSVLQNPAEYTDHEAYGKLADALIPKVDLTKKDLNADGVPFNVYGEEMIEHGAMEQMRVAARLPVSVRGAIMPDGHAGFGKRQLKDLLAEHKVTLIGAGMDESPMAYKDIHEVMARQTELVNVLGTFFPRVVRMDDGDDN